MKRHLFTLCVAIVASIGIISAETYSGTCGAEGDGSNLQWSFDTKTGVLTITGSGAMANYTWQDEAPWSSYNFYIESAELQNNVTTIGNYAFYWCISLASITIPNSVTSIGDYAFYLCSLTSIYIPNNVTTIGDWAFYGCSSLTSITIPESVTTIGSYAFDGCSSLTSIYIPNNVTTIGDRAFYGCSSLTSITIPESVTTIGGGAFDGCNGLTSITIPESVTTIGNYAFGDVPNIVYNGTATGSPWGAKSVNGYIESPLVYEDETKTNLLACFRNATEIVIPESVTSIGSSAFWACSSLTSISCFALIPPTLGNDVFSGVPRDIPLYVLKGSETLYQQAEGWKEFTNIQTVLKPFTINGLTYIPYAKDKVAELTYESLEADNYDTQTDLVIPSTVEFGGITLSVTAIGDSAFMNATSLTSVSIPNSVTSIGNHAFEGCTGLTSVSISNSVISIGDYAFANLNTRKFTSIVFPHSVQSIGKGVCANDIYLEEIEFGDDMEYIGDSAFYNCSRVMTMTSWSEFTPNVGTDALTSIKSSAELYVRSSCLRKYQMDDNWSRFVLKGIGATETMTASNSVNIQPQDNSAVFTWPTNDDAATYTIEITKDGTTVCMLIFNANGQLSGIAFAPGRDHTSNAPKAIMANNAMQFTVTGLDIATRYNFSLTAKDAQSNVVASYSGSFGTTGAEEENTPTILQTVKESSELPRKVLRNGQIYIQHAGKTYTLQGAEVK